MPIKIASRIYFSLEVRSQFIYNSASQSGTHLLPENISQHLEMHFITIFMGAAFGIQLGKANDPAKDPVMLRTVTIAKNYPAQNINSTKVRNLGVNMKV